MLKEKTTKKTLSIMIALIAMVIGAAAWAEAGAVWLGSLEVEAPTRLAIDKTGRVYITEANRDRLSIYDRKGEIVNMITGLKVPIGVAVDSAGKIYIGNDGTCSVEIYNSDYTFDKRIGGTSCTEAKEFETPNSIAVAGNGDIYVVDTPANKVKVYNAEGSAKFTFGEWGQGDGKFNVPLDIVIDERVGELYVVDKGIFTHPEYGLAAGARVQAFDLSGQFIRSFGEYGIGEEIPDGVMTSPVGIAVDGLERLNITDSRQEKVHIFDREGNFTGKIQDAEHPLKVPVGIAVGGDEREYIISSNNVPVTVEIYGLEDYTFLGVTPKEITLSGYAGGMAAGQDITISNSGLGDMQWWTQKAGGSEWITISKESGQTGGGASEAVTIGADLSALTEGIYTGTFKVITKGAEEEVTVSLQVQQAGASLEATPAELTYTGQAGGVQPISQTVGITLEGTSGITWAAVSSAPWLKIEPAGGTTGITEATVTADTTGLAAGQYNASITVTAAGAAGSPAEVKVTLILISAGRIEITANIPEAGWDISGAGTYEGSGTQWSQQDAPAGDYEISFKEVTGYIKPESRTFTVQSGQTTAIDVQYKDIRQKRKIIAATSTARPAEIKVLNTDGTAAGADFIAFGQRYGATVAAGDIDGDGIDEIIAGAGANLNNTARVKIFRADGSEIPGADFLAFRTKYGVNVAAGDIDGDGIDEIITGKGIGATNSTNIRVFKYIDGGITDTGINNIVDTSRNGVYVGAGDIDGDGKDEIITGTGPASKAEAVVRIFKADTSAGIGSWSAAQTKAITTGSAGAGAVVAAGDLNGDGKAEILAGSSHTLKIKSYKADGSAYGVEINSTTLFKGISIASGDTDADGKAEIVLGLWASKTSPSEIRVYSAAGALTNSFNAFSQTGGVNVGLGKVE